MAIFPVQGGANISKKTCSKIEHLVPIVTIASDEYHQRPDSDKQEDDGDADQGDDQSEDN